MVLEKTLEIPSDCKEIKPVKTVTKAEAPILWPPDAKRQLIGKDPDAGKDGRKKEKRAEEDEMVR